MASRLLINQMRIEHGRLWRWLAKTGSEDKDQWPGWKRLNYHAACDCFPCDAAGAENRDCRKCPIDWGIYVDPTDSNSRDCVQVGSDYHLWLYSSKLEDKKRIASKIAKMWPKNKVNKKVKVRGKK